MSLFQPQYLRNGVWVNGRPHPTRKAAVEQAQKVWKEQAFDAYRIKENDK